MDIVVAPRVASRQCPHCQSHYVARSRHQGVWGFPLIRLLRIYRYRCTECWRRFHGVGRH